jgi:predicted RND superfamily exporter protein
MNKLINLIVAAVIFYVIEFMLVPMLPGVARTFVSLIVVIIAIIYALGLLTDYNFPWNKTRH